MNRKIIFGVSIFIILGTYWWFNPSEKTYEDVIASNLRSLDSYMEMNFGPEGFPRNVELMKKSIIGRDLNYEIYISSDHIPEKYKKAIKSSFGPEINKESYKILVVVKLNGKNKFYALERGLMPKLIASD